MKKFEAKTAADVSYPWLEKNSKLKSFRIVGCRVGMIAIWIQANVLTLLNRRRAINLYPNKTESSPWASFPHGDLLGVIHCRGCNRVIFLDIREFCQEYC
jgi:hypothetical protein